MKKEILKRLLAKPGEEHSVSEFDARYTGDLTKSEAEALLAENIGKLSSLQDKLYAQDRYAVLVIFLGNGCCRKGRDDQACDVRHQSARLSGIFF